MTYSFPAFTQPNMTHTSGLVSVRCL